MATTLIVNADDFGATESVNFGIADAHLNGILTSASAMGNMPALKHAADLRSDIPLLGVGAHVSFNVGCPVLQPKHVHLLCRADGRFHASPLYHAARCGQRKYLEQVRNESRAQIEKLLEVGFNLDHINSQSHLHLLPPIFDVLVGLAEEFDIPYVRHSREANVRHPRGRRSDLVKSAVLGALADRRQEYATGIEFIGIRHTGKMSKSTLYNYIISVREMNGGVVELLTHPARRFPLPDRQLYHDFVYRYVTNSDRVAERDALVDEGIAKLVADSGIRLATFGEVALAKIDAIGVVVDS